MELQSIIYSVGVVTSLYLLGSLAQHIYTFLRPSSISRYLHESKDGKNKESWALITGASDGIGLSFAQELCGHGFNILLHGRNKQKLLGVQEQLKREYPASKTRIVVFDASDSSSIESIDERIHEFGGRRDDEEQTDDDEVNLTVLINNVGGMGVFSSDASCFPPIQDYTSSQLDSMLNLNARFTAQLTRLLLPTLIRNGPGLIMNISSSAAIGIPFTSVYAGSKGFLESFTKSIKAEMLALNKDVDVMCLKLSIVKTGGHKGETGFLAPTARKFAQAALNRVGAGALVWGYWPHALQMFPFRYLHESIIRKALIKAMTKVIEEDDLERENKKQK